MAREEELFPPTPPDGDKSWEHELSQPEEENFVSLSGYVMHGKKLKTDFTFDEGDKEENESDEEPSSEWNPSMLDSDDIEGRLYSFLDDSPIAVYLLSNYLDLNVMSAAFTMDEVCNLLLYMFHVKKIRDPSNTNMILCDGETELAMNMKSFHVMQLRGAVKKQMEDTGKILPERQEHEKPSFSPPQMKKRIVLKKRKIRLIRNTNALFYVKPQLLDLLRSVQELGEKENILPYSKVVNLLRRYISREKKVMLDDRNKHVANIAGTELERLFGCQSLHSSQTLRFLWRCIIPYRPESGDIVEYDTLNDGLVGKEIGLTLKKAHDGTRSKEEKQDVPPLMAKMEVSDVDKECGGPVIIY